ncbi:hypothetical protein V8G54_010185 [Vigna mungo]|uniref:PB1-like domain-containing protein n=1 Tax=Vigna mungo TaxID=3915 RepID=A0AAQ3NX35_VIGMU
MYFNPDLWTYFFVVSVVKSLGYDDFKELWFSVGCGPVLDDRLEALTDDAGGDEEAPQVNEKADGVEVEAERIEVDEADVERTEPYPVEVQAERIEVDEADVERTEPDQVEVQAERIEVDEADVERTEPDQVKVKAERIEVDEADVERTEPDQVEVQAERTDGERDRLDGEAYRIEVYDLDDVEVEVCDWSTSRDGDDGEMDSEDGLVDINVQCDVSENSSNEEVEVEPLVLGSESDMEENEINDSSWFNDEWKYEELTSPHISDEDSEHEEGYGHFSTFTMPKNMHDLNWEVRTYFVDKEDILDAIKSYAVENG